MNRPVTHSVLESQRYGVARHVEPPLGVVFYNQAAVLARLVEHVYTIEIIPSLGDSARQVLRRQGHNNVTVRIGDGYVGWPSKAPFDAIMVTAAPDHVPPALVEQLAEGGHLVLPVGDYYQELLRLTRRDGEVLNESLLPVRFVPMTGQAQE